MTVCMGVPVRHRIHDKRHVVAEIVGAARRRFHSATRRDARQNDLGCTALTICAWQGTEPVLGHDVVVRMLLQFRNKLGPIGGKRKFDSLELRIACNASASQNLSVPRRIRIRRGRK